MKWNIDDIPAFIAIVDHLSLSSAARALNVSKSTVSKSLARLENALGIRLIERNTRNIRLTSEGETFYRQGQLIMEQVMDANAVMSGLTTNPIGKLVVALPIAFSREILARHLDEFQHLHPEVELDLIITSNPVDLIRDQVDIAVVVGPLVDSEMVAKTLYRGRLMCVTSPTYQQRYNLGNSSEDLVNHMQICEKRYAINRLSIREAEQKKFIDLRQVFIQVNDPISVREAVLNGCGVALLPDQYCKSLVEKGELVEVYSNLEFESSASTLSAIYPTRRLLSSKTRAFLHFLEQICAQI